MDHHVSFFLQQAFNAAVAINHMKKLQQAHSELATRATSIPDIKVIDLSSNTRQELEPDKPEPSGGQGERSGTKHMSLPPSPVELKSQFHTLKVSHSQCDTHHLPTIAGKGKAVYHSEPANLNGFVQQFYLVLLKKKKRLWAKSRTDWRRNISLLMQVL